MPVGRTLAVPLVAIPATTAGASGETAAGEPPLAVAASVAAAPAAIAPVVVASAAVAVWRGSVANCGVALPADIVTIAAVDGADRAGSPGRADVGAIRSVAVVGWAAPPCRVASAEVAAGLAKIGRGATGLGKAAIGPCDAAVRETPEVAGTAEAIDCSRGVAPDATTTVVASDGAERNLVIAGDGLSEEPTGATGFGITATDGTAAAGVAADAVTFGKGGRSTVSDVLAPLVANEGSAAEARVVSLAPVRLGAVDAAGGARMAACRCTASRAVSILPIA
jgi:hypothetical protein